MLLDLLLLITGLVAVTFGANWLTDGASAVAKRLGITEFMIGVTIVAVGTSLPELVVSITAAVTGNADLSVGNIIGSNICNIFLILGLTSIIVSIPLTRHNIKIDIPITIAVSILFAFLAKDSHYNPDNADVISRLDGAIFLVLYIVFLIFMIKTSKEDTSSSEDSKPMKMWKASFFILIGLVALIAGGKFFVSGASGVARALGISDAVIGITVVAVGTSLPELATSLVAAIKGKSSMAIGNVLGSNIANILLIMGASATVSPLYLNDISVIDFAVMLSAPVLLLVFPAVFRTERISRAEGILFLSIYVGYTIFLIIH